MARRVAGHRGLSLPTQDLHAVWSTPMGVHQYAQASEINPLLVRVFHAMRATDPAADATSWFYASKDDLLRRVSIPEWKALVQFIVDSLRKTVVQANHGIWPEGAPGFHMAIQGIWFQVSNQGAHHDIHTHGNCSWSGVYCVQVDEPELRTQHPALKAHNGVTRFYGPYFNHLGGAHMDFGNAYLQAAHVDVEPVPGQLVVFPSWLPHQAMPYVGEADRIIVSFNASIHAESGSDAMRPYSGT